MAVIAYPRRDSRPARCPAAPTPAPSREALALQSKLDGGAVPLASLSPADRAGLDTLTRRGAVQLLLSGGTAFVARARR